MRVYPRTCGGTSFNERSARYTEGLSPHVRGNRTRPRSRTRNEGSIPARAGEPGGRVPRHRRVRVYPRTCGGTLSTSRACSRSWGLSPHVRGNPGAGAWADGGGGSIPARAGEPRLHGSSRSAWRVYPRTCGGTCWKLSPATTSTGLSPHVRGNRTATACSGGSTGSIPARAGEPDTPAPRSRACRVYPRTCGGTWTPHEPRPGCQGLSPHVRGNPVLCACQHP